MKVTEKKTSFKLSNFVEKSVNLNGISGFAHGEGNQLAC